MNRIIRRGCQVHSFNLWSFYGIPFLKPHIFAKARFNCGMLCGGFRCGLRLLLLARSHVQQQEEQRQAQVKKTARCCGQDMTKLGVSTFQLGEHTFLGGDLDHLLSGSMKMAVFRCEVCGRLKFFDPEWVQ